MEASWLDPINIQSRLPRRILVLSQDREDYYWTVRMLLDQGSHIEVLFRTYDQIPEQGVLDLVILFAPTMTVLPEAFAPLMANRPLSESLLIVEDHPGGKDGRRPGQIRSFTRAQFPAFVDELIRRKGPES